MEYLGTFSLLRYAWKVYVHMYIRVSHFGKLRDERQRQEAENEEKKKKGR